MRWKTAVFVTGHLVHLVNLPHYNNQPPSEGSSSGCSSEKTHGIKTLCELSLEPKRTKRARKKNGFLPNSFNAHATKNQDLFKCTQVAISLFFTADIWTCHEKSYNNINASCILKMEQKNFLSILFTPVTRQNVFSNKRSNRDMKQLKGRESQPNRERQTCILFCFLTHLYVKYLTYLDTHTCTHFTRRVRAQGQGSGQSQEQHSWDRQEVSVKDRLAGLKQTEDFSTGEFSRIWRDK